MKLINVVIGLNYGDEGKGLTTDYLADKLTLPAVVRFNGGAQAGHTVVRPDSLRHVFQHFGAGTMAGAPTILSRFFVVNPALFFKEAYDINDKGIKITDVYIDPRCEISTPYDVFINQRLERKRHHGRHGSCGIGFGETLERVSRGISLQVKDIGTKYFDDTIERIRYEYLKMRMDEEEIVLDEEEEEFILADSIAMSFKRDSKDLHRLTHIVNDIDAINKFPNLIFEGAQGLSLDQNSPDFPHVTRSNTGLTNVKVLLDEIEDYKLIVNYITRAFLTRHGAGPFENQVPIKTKKFADPTNKYNKFQGYMKFAPLDYERIKTNLEKDLAQIDSIDDINLMVTWCDNYTTVDKSPLQDIIDNLCDIIKPKKVMMSYGPKRTNVRECLTNAKGSVILFNKKN